MELNITKKEDKFYLKGNIANNNYRSLINLIEYILKQRDCVIINIEKVHEINLEAKIALKDLINYLPQKKQLLILEGNFSELILSDKLIS